MSMFLPPKAYPLNIAAGGSQPIIGPGTFARIQSASGGFNIGFDLGTPFASTVGRSYKCRSGENFSQITIENADPVNALAITVLVGNVEEIDDTLHVVGTAGGLALDGTDSTGVVPLAGGAGIRGWLSAIVEAMTATKNTPWTPNQTAKVVAAAGTPVQLSAVDVFVDALDIRANTANAGIIKVGFVAGAGNQLWELHPSEWRGVKAPNGKRINLKNVWVDAVNNGDGIVFESHV